MTNRFNRFFEWNILHLSAIITPELERMAAKRKPLCCLKVIAVCMRVNYCQFTLKAFEKTQLFHVVIICLSVRNQV